MVDIVDVDVEDITRVLDTVLLRLIPNFREKSPSPKLFEFQPPLESLSVSLQYTTDIDTHSAAPLIVSAVTLWIKAKTSVSRSIASYIQA